MTSLAGTGALSRLVLRLERIRLPAWILVLGLVPAGVAATFAELYPTAAEREQFARTVFATPALEAFLGRLFDPSVGGLTVWRVGTVEAVLVGLLSVFTVVRHTRAEEQAGRRELLGATVVGRHAPLAAALAVTIGADLVIGLVLALGLIGVGMPAAASIAFGLAVAGCGIAFAGVGAVTAQLAEGTGSARGLGVGAIGLSFALRMAGDGGREAGIEWLSWLSPIGWVVRVRAFAGEEWWVLALFACLAAVAVAAAFALAARRDVGAGVFATRPGPADAAPSLATPFGLARRLQGRGLLGWSAGFAVAGVLLGAIGDGFTAILEDNPALAQIFERLGGRMGVADAYLSAMFGVFAVIASAYAIGTTLTLDEEEEAGTADPILATPASRLEWAGSHLAFALGGPVLLMLLIGTTAGITYGMVVGDVAELLGRSLTAALIQVPAIWVLIGFAMALFGLAPRLVAAAWAVLVVFLLLGQLGQVLQLPQPVLDLSPFTHVPKPPAEEVAVLPLAMLTAVSAGLIAAGLVGLRRRDLG